MTDTVPIDVALRDSNLLGAALGDLASWRTWIAVLKAAFGRPLTAQERSAFDRVAGDREPPTRPVRELWCIAGRRSGKSRMAAAIAAYISTCIEHAGLAAGETGMVLTLSASMAQARQVHDYAEAFVTASPILRQRVRDVTAEQIRLDNRVTVATHTNSFRTVRGRTLLACVLDEVAFWRDEVSANPDVELYRAIVPALATTRGMLIGISSPYRRTGLLYSKFRSHFGQNSADVLVIKASTAVLNPSIDLGMIERARADDPASASSEWDAEFRLDLSSFLDDASIEAAIEHGRPLELPPREGTRYYSFVDMSGGRHDTCCISVVHKDGERLIADVVRGRQGDPAAAAREFCDLARQYRCATITGDNYAAEWVAGAIRDCGCDYQRSQLTRSELYLAGLVHWTRGAVRIPDQPALIRELRLLERRTARSGKDSVDHVVGGSDDHANALFGALHLASRPGQQAVICGPIIVTAPLGENRFSHPGW